jgi:hypothetical protein
MADAEKIRICQIHGLFLLFLRLLLWFLGTTNSATHSPSPLSFGGYFFAFFFAAFFPADFFIGEPQHQRVASDTPQASTTTSLPHGSQAKRSPFFVFSMSPPS